jgi:hypothetical protein
MRPGGEIDDLAGIAQHVTDDEVELGHTNLESHTGAGKFELELCHPGAG